MLESGPFWMNFNNPSREEMSDITNAFNLHPLTSEDIQVCYIFIILTGDTREKCEVFNNYYFVVIRTLNHDTGSKTFLDPITVYIVIFKECVLSVICN
jgi:magnesium transporter